MTSVADEQVRLRLAAAKPRAAGSHLEGAGGTEEGAVGQASAPLAASSCVARHAVPGQPAAALGASLLRLRNRIQVSAPGAGTGGSVEAKIGH
jgi:hypothetical protein